MFFKALNNARYQDKDLLKSLTWQKWGSFARLYKIYEETFVFIYVTKSLKKK